MSGAVRELYFDEGCRTGHDAALKISSFSSGKLVSHGSALVTGSMKHDQTSMNEAERRRCWRFDLSKIILSFGIVLYAMCLSLDIQQLGAHCVSLHCTLVSFYQVHG